MTAQPGKQHAIQHPTQQGVKQGILRLRRRMERQQECGGWRYSIAPSLESSCTIRNTRLHMFTRNTWGTVESVPCFADQNRSHYTKSCSEHSILISCSLGKVCFSTYCWHVSKFLNNYWSIFSQTILKTAGQSFSVSHWPYLKLQLFMLLPVQKNYDVAVAHTSKLYVTDKIIMC